MLNSVLAVTNNFGLRVKFALVLIPITLVALFFAGSQILSQRDDSSQLGRMQSLADYAVTASNFVHESQKESGATGVFVGSNG